MASRTPITASRFGITIDGVEVASFSELQGISTQVDTATGRSIAPHELAHVVAQSGRGRAVTFRTGKLTATPEARMQLTNAKGRRVTITAFDRKGKPMSAIAGIAGSSGRGAAQQEWTITYETIQRVL